ncbi:hypothetical protein HYN56_14010 [Flavobacterium crocinum]|uniref:Uncharacterized protein n=1 Tax=Flavobacterium crocinum TaxID=2183896 RepID=A0A2S1YMH7_9FLAO|nr:hypothetical protein [Flavobacterium crocinum]AWK05289.1 hypothetical protein HYN56_14010 [Flavobacterium crocinum]
MHIDTQTLPHCKIEEDETPRTEYYVIYTPIFSFPEALGSNLENSIVLFGENNFKEQLLILHNIINNHEEHELLKNYQDEDFDRKAILELINFYFEKNKNIETPWDKYYYYLSEKDYFYKMTDERGENLYYGEYKNS